jgi:sporulation protein YlmC with PRC-barrel domain
MSEKLHLVHDVLDKLVLDRDKHRMGRVDSLVLQLEDGAPPRVVYLEMGGVALAHRLGGLARWLGTRLAAVPHEKPARAPYRIAWDLVRQVGAANIVVDVDAESSRAMAWERWLAQNVVARLGG